MDALLFAMIVAALAMSGLVLGLAVAPRLWRWDERRSRAEEDDPDAGGGEDGRD